ncbi:MAG: adenylate/guanylate cyclase domain-containing protein [Gammaproteobacteria bacterium]|nr:adenylate/guanylate cyclase domain-containing protein [Planctomycetota bacterium]MCB1749647.1 adenylate/guanylate cyclase domain-containing protein [Gammaproteobacteria bacterium]MCP5201697.1 adenylate/guanylate cyclase domain-containing protein [Gammaproteobacteria bacterium]
MAEPTARGLAVLSADIAGSTALYDTLGDNAARDIVAGCLDALRHYCVEHGGHVVAEIGDQIVAQFMDATEAAAVASEIHVHLHEQHAERDDVRPRMRVGLHFGTVPQGGDPLGCETHKIADWACRNAKPEQTLATRALIDQLPRIFRAVSRYVDDETWNFVSIEHVELYEVIWDVESITAYAGEKPGRDDGGYSRVVFSHGDASITVDAERPVVSIGRAPHNDLVIRKDLISRQHLSAQFSRGRCTVTDNSTNGSLVVLDDGTRFDLKRDSLRLSGSGVIIPGKPERQDDAYAISFRCE